MATNKRKEAAALFELIDKSTLKVPKHAGALRIPDWWSSKSNPAPASRLDTPSTPEKMTAAEPIAEQPLPVQPRLFEPPPAGSSPTISPSIRPPANPATPRAARPAPIAPSLPHAPPVEPEEPAPTPAVPDRPAARRTFAPQTMDQGNAARHQWMGQQKRRMARTPPWAVLAAVAAALIVVCLIVLLIMSLRPHPRTVQNAGSNAYPPAAPANEGATLLPPRKLEPPPPEKGRTSPRELAEHPESTDRGTPAETPTVHAPGTVQRSPELYYVVISSTPTASVAQKNAEFLVRHGIDVSIEIVTVGNAKTRWYKLISVRGFPTMVAAEPFRKEIVQIGHLHPDFKKYKKVWDDAFITRLTPIPPK